VWEPEKTKIQMDYLANHPDVDFLFCGITYIDEHDNMTGKRTPVGYGHAFPDILLGNSILPPTTVIFKRDLLLRAGPFNESLRQGEDYEYFIRCAKHGTITY